jgi:hypothetical protein
VAEELSRRLGRIFLRDAEGKRAVFGDNPKLQSDPHFKDLLQFHEYFHGDSGRGVGAAHQTGWTGLIAKLLHPRCPPQHGTRSVTEKPLAKAARPRREPHHAGS